MKTIFVIFVINCAATFASYQENFLMNNLRQYFDDKDLELVIENENGASEIIIEPSKREAITDLSQKGSKLQLDSKNEKSRPNHYWTRKRGRETTNNWWNHYQTNYNIPQYQFGYPNSMSNARGKRAIEKLLAQTLAHLRARRETSDDENPTENVEKPTGDGEAVDEDVKKRNERDNLKVGGNFRRSM
jgi:hypothetical protein